MEEDKRLYQEFINGNKESFEKLITKYKTNLIYFIYKKEALINKGREFVFDSEFILYLKENNKDKPYFALKVDNTDVLIEAE